VLPLPSAVFSGMTRFFTPSDPGRNRTAVPFLGMAGKPIRARRIVSADCHRRALIAGQIRPKRTKRPGDVVHLYHGSRKNRQYVERYQILHDSIRDVEIDREGEVKRLLLRPVSVDVCTPGRGDGLVRLDPDLTFTTAIATTVIPWSVLRARTSEVGMNIAFEESGQNRPFQESPTGQTPDSGAVRLAADPSFPRLESLPCFRISIYASLPN
jgi:hypothetical protein